MTDTRSGAGGESQIKLIDLGDGTFAYAMATVGSAFAHIAGAGTTTVKSGPGILRKIITNKAVSASVTTIYDSLTGSGQVIAIVTNPLALLQSQVPLEYNLAFSTGLTIVTSGADDLTVVYN